jgi:TonB family protein
MAAGPDATPRLLSATTGLIWLNADRFTPEPPPQLVNAVLHLTVRGRVAEVDVPPAFADLKENFMHALRAWSFAPARRDGQPVATTLTLPLVVQPRPIPGKAAPPSPPPPAHMPVALRQPQPVYPQEMLRSRMDGEVVVEFALDAEGSVQNPAVVRSSDHGFEAAALAAVKKWKFKPATLADGTPVPVAKMQVPLVFQRRIQGPFALP